MLKDLLEKQKQTEKEYNDTKAQFNKILKDLSDKAQIIRQEIMDAFVEEKLYLPLSKLKEYKDKNITSIKLPRIGHRLCVLSDVFINSNNELESPDYSINSVGFLGFYDIEIDGKIIEETTMGYLINERIRRENT